MYAVMFTVACYTISSLGDKYTSSKLKCTPAEFSFIVPSATMAWIGIAIPLTGWSSSLKRICLLSLLFILSKFLYGLTLGWMASGCKPTSTLFLVMLLVALTQLKRIKLMKIRKQKGIGAAALTRLPNAAGLICEASVAMESLFLYAMVQPAQLAILFGISLIKKEPMSKKKLAGSLICIFSVCAITVLISK